MLSCIAEASTAYHVPVPAIERVLDAAKSAHGSPSAGVGPMGIPSQWLSVLGAYGFPVETVRRNACWGIAAGTWILAVERMYAHVQFGARGRFAYPSALPAIPSQIIQYAHQAQAVTGVPADMLLAVAAQESGFNPRAVSPAGAQGLMQFIPSTWARYGRGSPFDPRAAMMAGALYLRHLAMEFQSWPLALAGYNAGGQAVVDAGYQIPPFRQTQNYVPAVLAHYRQIAAGAR